MNEVIFQQTNKGVIQHLIMGFYPLTVWVGKEKSNFSKVGTPVHLPL